MHIHAYRRRIVPVFGIVDYYNNMYYVYSLWILDIFAQLSKCTLNQRMYAAAPRLIA